MTATDAGRPAPPSMFPRALTILRVRGIPIRLHLSWVLIAGLVLWIFWTRFSQLLAPFGAAVVVASAAVLALVFFASIVAHELGHALTSLGRGIPVRAVTLFLLGGVTESAREAERPRDDLAIVGAGPFVSLVLASLFGLAHALAPGPTPYGAVTGYAAWLNLALAVFNVLPAFPLDGGRLLRGVLWAATGRPHQATRWAARVGMAFGGLLLAAGLNGLLGGPVPSVDGPLSWLVVLLIQQGLWGMLIGFFLLRGAMDAHRAAAARLALARHRAGEVMGQAPPTLPSDIPVAAVLPRLREYPSLLWPVGTPLVGALYLPDVEERLEEAGSDTAADLARPLDRIAVDAEAPLDAALDRMLDAPGQTVVVTRDGVAVGLLTPSLVGGLLP